MSEQLQIALIAAGSALAGMALSSLISLVVARGQRKHDGRVLLCSKYEEMMLLFTESYRWLGEINSVHSSEELYRLSFSTHARKALSLCLLYFPELVDEANDYSKSIASYYSYVTRVFDPNVHANVGGQALTHGPGEQHMDKLLNAKESLEQAVLKWSSKYAHS